MKDVYQLLRRHVQHILKPHNGLSDIIADDTSVVSDDDDNFRVPLKSRFYLVSLVIPVGISSEEQQGVITSAWRRKSGFTQSLRLLNQRPEQRCFRSGYVIIRDTHPEVIDTQYAQQSYCRLKQDYENFA